MASTRPKTQSPQALARREPRQARALFKVELMLEAAMRLIEQDGLDALNTNRVAELAGVSIGSLYQYFPDKRALLQALARREVEAMAAQVKAALAGPVPPQVGDRVRAVVRAVLQAYGGRAQVHRLLLAQAMAPVPGNPIGGLQDFVAGLFTQAGVQGADGRTHRIPAAEAFVLGHAVAGALRAIVASTPAPAPAAALEDAVVRLVTAFLAAGPAAP